MQWRLGLKAHPYVSISFCETHVRVHPPTHSPHPTHSLTPHIHHTLLLSHTFSLPRYLIHIVARTPALHRYMVRGDRSAITPILRRLGKWYSNVWGSVDGGIFAQCYDEDETNCPSYVDTALYLRSSTAGVLCAVLPPPPPFTPKQARLHQSLWPQYVLTAPFFPLHRYVNKLYCVKGDYVEWMKINCRFSCSLCKEASEDPTQMG
jgi:hypothetical protein